MSGWKRPWRAARGWTVWLRFVPLLLLGPAALGHKVSDSFLRLDRDGERLRGQWSLALHDLEVSVGVDANGDGAITWGELKGRREPIISYAASHLTLATDRAPLRLEFSSDVQVDHLLNGGYAVLRFEASCPLDTEALTLEYRAFFDDNPLHRGLVMISGSRGTRQAVLSPVETRHRFEFARPRPYQEFGLFVGEGVRHIGLGYDHLLFLLVLLLPAVLQRSAGAWTPVTSFRVAAVGVVKVVTAFTLAHSITLTLAALDIVRLPARLVEPVIAASIILAALNNLRPRVASGAAAIAFGFGLIHGFGFASALADLGLPAGSLGWALLGFNLGVELGQLAVVSAFLPLAYLTRTVGAGFYPAVVLRGGSILAAMVATWWLGQRLWLG